MRIKKTSQTTPIQAQVVNVESNSTTDSYSCDYVNNNVGKEVYSTNEQVIGTWIDGKPLYRKVIQGTTPAMNDTILTDILSNVSYCRIVYCILNNIRPYTYYCRTYNATTTALDFVVQNNTLSMRALTNEVAQNSFILTVEYTKTTD